MDYKNSDIRLAVEEVIHNRLYREILLLRLVDGLTYEAIAEKVDRSPRQIGYILSKHIPRVFDYLKSVK